MPTKVLGNRLTTKILNVYKLLAPAGSGGGTGGGHIIRDGETKQVFPQRTYLDLYRLLGLDDLAADATGIFGPAYATISNSSITIGDGTHSISVESQLSWTQNQFALLTAVQSPTNFFTARVDSYNPSSGAMNLTEVDLSGAGTFSEWQVNITGGPAEGYRATSNTSVTPGTGSFVLTLNEPETAWAVNSIVRVVSLTNSNNFFQGVVSAYSGTQLTIGVDTNYGGATDNNWAVTPGTGAPGQDGDRYRTTSATPITLPLNIDDIQALTVEAGLQYMTGQPVGVTSRGNDENYFVGKVTSYNEMTGALSLRVIESGGTGTHTDWDVNLTGIPGVDGRGYYATSTTLETIGLGSKTFTTDQDADTLAWLPGASIRVTSVVDPNDWMQGLVTAYSGQDLTINVTTRNGTGAANNWNFNPGAGEDGRGYYTTSSSNVLIGTGTKTFTTEQSEDSLAWVTGAKISAINASNANEYMDGVVTSYSGTTLEMDVTNPVGSGFVSNWVFASPSGEKGDKGDQGDQGIQGDPGQAATADAGTTTTGAPGTDAEVTNVGTTSAAIFDFTIPRGDTGAQGIQGEQGEQGMPGQGVPVGGTVNQVLAKASAADYDTQWVNQSGGGGTPGGANTQVQFNDSGSFGGSANFTWDGATLNLISPSAITPSFVLTQALAQGVPVFETRDDSGTPLIQFLDGNITAATYNGISSADWARLSQKNVFTGAVQTIQSPESVGGIEITSVLNSNVRLKSNTGLPDENEFAVDQGTGGFLAFTAIDDANNPLAIDRLRLYNAGGVVAGEATGGDQGIGSINAKAYLLDGVPVIGTPAGGIANAPITKIDGTDYNYRVGGAIAITSADLTTEMGRIADTATGDGIVIGFLGADGNISREKGNIQLDEEGLALLGSTVVFDKEIRGGQFEPRPAYFDPISGNIISGDPLEKGWERLSSDPTDYDLGSGAGAQPWVDLTNLSITTPEDVESGDRVDVAINLYVENKSDIRTGVVEYDWIIGGTPANNPVILGQVTGGFKGYLGDVATLFPTFPVPTGSTVTVRARINQGSTGLYGVDLLGSVNPHQLNVSIPGEGGGGGSGIGSGATFPVSPVVDELFLLTLTNRTGIYRYDGSTWQIQTMEAGWEIYVDPLGTDNPNNGDGTGADAFATLEYAFAFAAQAPTDGMIRLESSAPYTMDSVVIPTGVNVKMRGIKNILSTHTVSSFPNETTLIVSPGVSGLQKGDLVQITSGDLGGAIQATAAIESASGTTINLAAPIRMGVAVPNISLMLNPGDNLRIIRPETTINLSGSSSLVNSSIDVEDLIWNNTNTPANNIPLATSDSTFFSKGCWYTGTVGDSFILGTNTRMNIPGNHVNLTGSGSNGRFLFVDKGNLFTAGGTLIEISNGSAVLAFPGVIVNTYGFSIEGTPESSNSARALLRVLMQGSVDMGFSDLYQTRIISGNPSYHAYSIEIQSAIRNATNPNNTIVGQKNVDGTSISV